eukprot:5971450-Ditylum_brightwellii.AAC.1
MLELQTKIVAYTSAVANKVVIDAGTNEEVKTVAQELVDSAKAVLGEWSGEKLLNSCETKLRGKIEEKLSGGSCHLIIGYKDSGDEA